MNGETSKGSQVRLEHITRGVEESRIELGRGISVCEFASARLGAKGFSTGIARFTPGSALSYHLHPCGESITILQGTANVLVDGRLYELIPFDSIQIPADVPHAVRNVEESGKLVAHTAFFSADVSRALVEKKFSVEDRDHLLPEPNHPESLLRFAQTGEYELSRSAFFRDLFARRLGSKGICGGYGRFAPGASLPCHTHKYDESITIVEGMAICLVAGRCYTLSGYDTALIPDGLPHRFINRSEGYMAMLWVYAGDEPERTIVEDPLCSVGLPMKQL